ncbi:MAG TPA: Holliday junction branch migration protein RuvA [Lachnospiraceae bacterium]|nr:Holliday junction branch migration protein RuvA [Lachnospiraceae bacterium]
MIAFLKGKIADLTEGSVVLDVNGVGYEVLVPGQLLSMLDGIGQEIKLYTYMQIREDAAVLFGFLTKDDLGMFRMLTGVSGVGPKAGLNILSSLGADDLRLAILADDAKRIAKAPGIGAKTAQKIILELKDKLDLEDVLEKRSMSSLQPSAPAVSSSQAVQEAVEALVALGYGSTEALKTVRAVKLSEDMDVEDILKEALKRMAF